MQSVNLLKTIISTELFTKILNSLLFLVITKHHITVTVIRINCNIHNSSNYENTK